MEKEIVVLDTFEGHIVLMCKNWYSVKGVDFFDAIRRLWTVRCGIPQEYANKKLDENIADGLYRIMSKCNPERMNYFHEVLHRELLSYGSIWRLKPDVDNHLQALIWEYRRFISQIQIKETGTDGKYYTLISLPKAQKQIIKRIVRGNGEYEDYGKLTKADKRDLIIL